MASSSGNSSGSLQFQSSGSKEGLMDQRKRKRMLSNRESARRSRMRKQTHLNDLTAQISRLKEDNDQIHSNLSITSQQYLNVEAENSVLRAQMGELSQRLDALNNILNYLDASKGVFGSGDFEAIPKSYMNDSWNSMYFNHASADMFLY